MKFLISGLKKEIELRKISLADEIWIAEKFPDYSERLSRANPDMGMICEIVYRLIVDKSQFVTEKIKTVNEKGEAVEFAFGGVEKFTRACLTEVDSITIMTAFVEACNKSRPDAGKDVKKEDFKFPNYWEYVHILASLYHWQPSEILALSLREINAIFSARNEAEKPKTPELNDKQKGVDRKKKKREVEKWQTIKSM